MPYQHKTSGEAYKEAVHGLGNKQQRVLEAILYLNNLYGSCNDRMIQEHLNWPINTITNRRGELVIMDKIYEYKKSKDSVTNRTTSFWKVADVQLKMF